MEKTKEELMLVYPVLKYFEYAHLPVRLQEVSGPFCELAVAVARMHDTEEKAVLLGRPEVAACLRKLLEAKDCAVRAAL